jgi:hypothetical protein
VSEIPKQNAHAPHGRHWPLLRHRSRLQAPTHAFQPKIPSPGYISLMGLGSLNPDLEDLSAIHELKEAGIPQEIHSNIQPMVVELLKSISQNDPRDRSITLYLALESIREGLGVHVMETAAILEQKGASPGQALIEAVTREVIGNVFTGLEEGVREPCTGCSGMSGWDLKRIVAAATTVGISEMSSTVRDGVDSAVEQLSKINKVASCNKGAFAAGKILGGVFAKSPAMGEKAAKAACKMAEVADGMINPTGNRGANASRYRAGQIMRPRVDPVQIASEIKELALIIGQSVADDQGDHFKAANLAAAAQKLWCATNINRGHNDFPYSFVNAHDQLFPGKSKEEANRLWRAWSKGITDYLVTMHNLPVKSAYNIRTEQEQAAIITQMSPEEKARMSLAGDYLGMVTSEQLQHDVNKLRAQIQAENNKTMLIWGASIGGTVLAGAIGYKVYKIKKARKANL